MILKSIDRSIRRKLMVVMLVTTMTSLLVAAVALVTYELRNYERSWSNDLQTQADILARATAPALWFDDARSARENLALLKARPQILAAAIYSAKGRLFATYATDKAQDRFPTLPGTEGYEVVGDQIVLFHRIVENNEILGTVYLRATYGLMDRLTGYVTILGAVLLLSLVVAILMSAWLQAAITKPILAITQVAREVMERRDFSLRVRKTTEDEIGYLVDAFNDMLAEIGRRAAALEASNLSLQHEMAERRGAEEALRAADKRKDEFLATLAHELRNPLAPMRNALRILDVAGGDPTAQKRARDMMERQLQQMVRLVDDLLDVSRITTGKLALRTERTDLATVIRNAVDTARPFVDSRGHALAVKLPHEPVYLDADPTRLAQVFSNLLNNAAKYTDPGGRIALSAVREGDKVVITVTDNGIGIAPGMQHAIFDMFTQVDHSLERSHAGLGVGLTLARRLVELHGGTIEAKSDGLNRGSQFQVSLPVAATATEPQTAPQDAAGTGAVNGHRILVADDNVDFADSFALILRMLGNEVRVTHDGAEALQMAKTFEPEFCFLDIGLPKINGYDLAERLRAAAETRNSTLIAVTGWGQDKDRQRAHAAGFDHHMVKPVDAQAIEALLRSASKASTGSS
ncbi:MAG TPA: ATP-binding protein [Casimicrobiaceae bacterium]|nr:ATP-binding protein [Casimicrobiaceae bacterium]